MNFREVMEMLEPKNKEIAHQQVVIDRLSHKIEIKIKENKELQERIDKATKIIENALVTIEQCIHMKAYYQDKNLMGHTWDKEYTEKKIKDLLKILKGEE